ncbi:MAG: RluA family pseudouridine synthase [Erysipelotrichaceae bacterium]|nr:RluA family pseudouridine synthase [Erysipelotrichaceae bacterium]
MEKFLVNKGDENQRLDNYLALNTDISRSKIQSLIKEEKILVNNHLEKNSYLVRENDEITLEYVETENHLKPEKMNLNIVYEDNDIIVINKPNGLVVHPAPGNYEHTLANGLAYYSNSLSDINGEFRPGIVHRIDAYTTGLLVVAKNNKAHEVLALELAKKEVKRTYLALVWGVITEDSGTIDAPIGRDPSDRKKMAINPKGKEAVTHFKVLERFKKATLLEVYLDTGRTHQIRVHMDYIKHPIVNDPVYGKRELIDETGQCLHAMKLELIHPTTKEKMEFTCDAPECFKNILEKLKMEV